MMLPDSAPSALPQDRSGRIGRAIGAGLLFAGTWCGAAGGAEEASGRPPARPPAVESYEPPEIVGHVIVRAPAQVERLMLGRCLPVEEGAAFDLLAAERVEAARQEISRLSWVSEVDVRWRHTDDPRVKDLIFQVTPARTGSLYVALSYRGRYGLVPAAALYLESVFGTLHYVHMDWTMAFRTRTDFSTRPMNIGRIEFGRPPICTRYYWSGSVSRQLEGLRYYHFFDQTMAEGRLTGGRLLPWNFQAELGYRYSDIQIGDAPSPLRLPEGIGAGRMVVAGVTASILHDTRNDKYYARRGHLLKLEGLFAHRGLLSTHDFARVTLTFHQYLWAAWRLVVKPVLHAGWATHGVAFTERPYPLEPEWSQSMFVGGLGPLSNGNEIGGRLSAFVGMEARVMAISGILHLTAIVGGANAWDEPVAGRLRASRPGLRPFVGIRLDAPVPGGAYLGMSFGWAP